MRYQKFTKMEAADCRVMKKLLQPVLDRFGTQHNLDISILSGRYDGEMVGYKIEFKIAGTESVDMKTARVFMGEDINETADVKDIGECRIVGFKPRSTKYPWIILRPDGKKYKWTDDSVQRHFGKK